MPIARAVPMSIRLREEEADAIERLADTHNLTASSAIRLCVRVALGLPVSSDMADVVGTLAVGVDAHARV